MWTQRHISEVAEVPWRNGGGTTREFLASEAINPARAGGTESGPLPWAWRVSVAEVASDGPFSHFPGTRRHFAVLRGNGVRLRIAEQDEVTLAPTHSTLTPTHSSPVLSFSGELPCTCSLVDGPTSDFNLMCRGVAVGTLERLDGGCEAGPAERGVPRGATVGVYAVTPTQVAEVDGGTAIDLAPDTLAWCFAGDRPLAVVVRGEAALFFVIREAPGEAGVGP
jgi:environmental stress-induced protein Ves